MDKTSGESLTKSKLLSMRDKWASPDSQKGWTWDYDGIPGSTDDYRSYDREMESGLEIFQCKTFDELIVLLTEKLGRKPNVIDLMGGAYFLNEPENAESVVGIRVNDKDDDMKVLASKADDEDSRKLKKTMSAQNRKIVEADLLTTAGWKNIEQGNLAKADLLVCRPVGPFDNLHAMRSNSDKPAAYIGLYTALFERMLNLVNKEDGVIFTEVPDIFTDEEVAEFFKKIDEREHSKTTIFIAPPDFGWARYERRFVVTQFNNKNI